MKLTDNVDTLGVATAANTLTKGNRVIIKYHFSSLFMMRTILLIHSILFVVFAYVTIDWDFVQFYPGRCSGYDRNTDWFTAGAFK
jgi:hypothetical protein